MSARVLLVLGVAAAAALVLALVVFDRPVNERQADGGDLLLPALEDGLNTIEAIDIIASSGETVATLRRERERWRMREMHDYEADFARIHGLLRALADARRLDARTDDSRWYGRLGVASTGEGDGAGLAIRFPDSGVPGLLVGKPDPAGLGRYVRIEDQAQTWLTGADIDVSVDRADWLERAIMDIPAGDIAGVDIRHGDSPDVALRPGDEEGSVWVLLDAPPEREIKQAWELRQTANALARLNLESVRPHDSGRVPDDAVESVFRTRDGLVFTLTLFSDAQGHWVHFQVGADQDAVDGASVSDDGDDAGDAGREIDAVAVDGRLSPWQYGLEESRFDRLTRTVEDLLVSPDSESGQETGTATQPLP